MSIIKLRTDTSIMWGVINPILAEGELGIESDTTKEKVGDGITTWENLQYRFNEVNPATEVIYYLDPLTTGPGVGALRNFYPDFAALKAADDAPGWYELGDHPTEYVYYMRESIQVDITILKSQINLEPYAVMSNGENRVIVLDDTQQKVAFIRLTDLGDARAQTLPEDTRYEIDSGWSRNTFIVSKNWSSCAERELWISNPSAPPVATSGHILAPRRHFQYEFYCDVRTPGLRTSVTWVPVGFHAMLLSTSNSDGWGNSAELSSNGFLQRFSLNDSKFTELHSEVGKTTIISISDRYLLSGVVTANYQPVQVMNQTFINTVDMILTYDGSIGYYLPDDAAVGARLRFVSINQKPFLVSLPSGHATLKQATLVTNYTTAPWNTPCRLANTQHFLKFGNTQLSDTLEMQYVGNGTWVWSVFDFASYTDNMIAWSQLSKVGALPSDIGAVPEVPTTINRTLAYARSLDGWVLAGGSDNLVTTTRQELVDLIDDAALIPGKYYKFVYYPNYVMPGTAIRIQGTQETIKVLAADATTLDPRVTSVSYPQDIIIYEFVDTSVDAGLYGRILYRENPTANVSAHFDWRGIQFRRWNTQSDGLGAWTSRVDNGFPFQDFYTFGSANPSIAQCINVSLGPYGTDRGTHSNNVFLGSVKDFTTGPNFVNNTIGDVAIRNSIGPECYGNTIGSNFSDNDIAGNFVNNVLGNYFMANCVGFSFSGNTIQDDFKANTTGIFFTNNTIGIQCRDNLFNNDINGNVIGQWFSTNTVLYNLINCIVGEYCKHNIMGGGTSVSIGTDFKNNTVMCYMNPGTVISDAVSFNHISQISVLTIPSNTSGKVLSRATSTIEAVLHPSSNLDLITGGGNSSAENISSSGIITLLGTSGIFSVPYVNSMPEHPVTFKAQAGFTFTLTCFPVESVPNDGNLHFIGLSNIVLNGNYSDDVTFKRVTITNVNGTFTALQQVHKPVATNLYHGVVSRSTVAPLPSQVLAMPFAITCGTTPLTYYYKGTLVTVSSDILVTLPSAGKYFLYFTDAIGTLGFSTVFPNLYETVLIASVIWNGVDLGLVGEERHNHTRNISWHLATHEGIGTRYITGLALTMAGTTNATSTFSVSPGQINDEDIRFIISTFTSGRIWYQTGVSTYNFLNALSTRPYWGSAVDGGGIYAVNATTYAQLTTNQSNRYFNYFVYAATDVFNPIYIIAESTTVVAGHTTAANARLIAPPQLGTTNLSTELKLLFRVVVNGAGLIQTPVAADDYRTGGSIPGGGILSVLHDTTSPLLAGAGVNFGHIQTPITPVGQYLKDDGTWATPLAVTPTLKVTALPVYADNAAALAGGLTSGDAYRTATGVAMWCY